MPEAARRLFEEFKSQGLDRIRRCVEDKEQESFLIDFKTNGANRKGDGKRVGSNKVTDETKAVLGQALSAFANSGGGVLVWGIEDSNDRAETPVPIPRAAEFSAALGRISAGMVEPPLDGVEHLPILDPELDDESGYVITYIPDGKVKPHRCAASGKQIYYLRSSGTSPVMADSAVRAFVRSGSLPRLAISTHVTDVKYNPSGFSRDNDIAYGGTLEASIGIMIQNTGVVMAEDVAVAVEKVDRLQILPQNAKTVFVRSDEEEIGQFVALMIAPEALKIHVGVAHIMTQGLFSTEDHTGYSRVYAKEPLRFRYAIFARHFSRYGWVEVPRPDLETDRPTRHSR